MPARARHGFFLYSDAGKEEDRGYIVIARTRARAFLRAIHVAAVVFFAVMGSIQLGWLDVYKGTSVYARCIVCIRNEYGTGIR